MKNKIFFLILIALIFTAVFLWPKKHTNPSSSPTGKKNYENYRADLSLLKVSFDHPADWKPTDDEGKIDRYSQIIVLGPKTQEDSYRPSFVVRGVPVKGSEGGWFDSLEKFKMNHLIHVYKDRQIVAENKTPVAQIESEDIVYTHTIPASHIHNFQHPEFHVKSRVLFFRDSHQFYQIIYSADVKQFDLYQEDFDHLLESFTFEHA